MADRSSGQRLRLRTFTGKEPITFWPSNGKNCKGLSNFQSVGCWPIALQRPVSCWFNARVTQFDMSKTIGFIGTGIMGRRMAANLIRKGHKVSIYNRTRTKAEEVAKAGGAVADTPAKAAEGADVVITMVADPKALFEVIEGENGVLKTIRRDAVLIDSSTVSPPATLRVFEALKARGAHMLDAPVFGSKNEAERGELGFIVGGEKEIVARVQDVLDCMGKTNYVGGNGKGAYTKLVVNLVVATTLEAFNEGMVLATKAGIDPDLMLQIIQSSRARSGIIDMKGPQILKRDFNAFFPLKLMGKDMNLALETARELGASMPCVTALAEVYRQCLQDGLADEDFAATIKLLEKQAGVVVKSRGETKAS
jgi:3-hydroxyisobutyrate dehydrogenase-like beta-hydroxyacid dehydrogenase